MSAALLALALTFAGPDTGWVAGPDGVRLYYEKIGAGPTTIIVPGRLFLARDLAPLGAHHTLILYDMRNRGRSSRVEDGTLLTIQKDVEDLEAVRRHFGVERFVPVGYSYLGLMVVLYAMDHPDHVDRVVQLGPVPRKFGTEYPASLLHTDSVPVVDSAAAARVDSLKRSGFAREHPKEFCYESRRAFDVRLVGDPTKAAGLMDPCGMPNEWPLNLERHFEHHFAGVQRLDVTEGVGGSGASTGAHRPRHLGPQCALRRGTGVGADPAERPPHHRRARRPPGDGRRARDRPFGDRHLRERAVAGARREDHFARARPAPVIDRAAALPRNASSTICACCSMP